VDREKVLFRDVERRTPNATRAVSTAIGEVTLGRNHLRRVAHYLDSAVGGDPASLAEVAENLHSAEKVLRKVIALEEDSLLSLIESGRDKEGSTDLEVEIQKIDDRHRKMLGRVTCRRIASVLWA
jgi:hemerythrin-like domain-containing protein